MAQDDDVRDDSTQQEFNDTDRVEESGSSDALEDPADVRDADMQQSEDDLDDTDSM
jgi:hypothetical protein